MLYIIIHTCVITVLLDSSMLLSSKGNGSRVDQHEKPFIIIHICVVAV